MPADQQSNPLGVPVKLEGLNSTSPSTLVYPDSPDLQNVRFGKSKEILTRTGFAKYNTTAMPVTIRAITGVAELNRRDTTTKYTIVADQEKLFVVPTSGAWTTLASTLGASATDYWDFAVFNNELICVNGVSTPQVTDGTAAGTTALTSKVWQSRTSSPNNQTSGASGLRTLYGIISNYGGSTVSGGSGDPNHQAYDELTDTWKVRAHATLTRRDGAGFSMNNTAYLANGYDTLAAAVTATIEQYDPVADAWTSRTSNATKRTHFQGLASAVYGFLIGGDTDTGRTTAVATNERYDPVTDTWTTVTAMTAAKSRSAYYAIGSVGYVVSGANAVPALVATNYAYNMFADAWTTQAAVTVARDLSAGAPGWGDGNGYVIAGDTNVNDSGPSSTVYSYNVASNAWTTETSIAANRFTVAAGRGSSTSIFSHGGNAAGPSATATMERFNSSPAAPTAFYVKSHGGYVFLARTSSFPSRLYFSVAGNARIWPYFNFLDVFPDDGDWITGMFVFDGRLYVTKNKRIYWISGTVFDPDVRIGNQRPILLPNIPGCVSNRSIVVTDLGVFYLSADGFRVFNGARSDLIGDKVKASLDGYVQSRMSAVCGLWVKKYNEVWWSLTSSGTTHNVVLAYHVQHHLWTRFVGMNIEAMASVDDANLTPQILFGTGDTQGFLFTADSGTDDNGTAINAYYQTGWFPVSQQTREASGRFINMFIKRSGNWNVQIDAYRNYGTAAFATPGWPVQLNTLSGTYGDAQFFQDATDQLAVISMSLDGHHGALRLTVNALASTFELYAIFVQGHDVRRAGRP